MKYHLHAIDALDIASVILLKSTVILLSSQFVNDAGDELTDVLRGCHYKYTITTMHGIIGRSEIQQGTGASFKF